MMSHSEDISVDRFEKILEGTSVSLFVCSQAGLCHFFIT